MPNQAGKAPFRLTPTETFNLPRRRVKNTRLGRVLFGLPEEQDEPDIMMGGVGSPASMALGTLSKALARRGTTTTAAFGKTTKGMKGVGKGTGVQTAAPPGGTFAADTMTPVPPPMPGVGAGSVRPAISRPSAQPNWRPQLNPTGDPMMNINPAPPAQRLLPAPAKPATNRASMLDLDSIGREPPPLSPATPVWSQKYSSPPPAGSTTNWYQTPGGQAATAEQAAARAATMARNSLQFGTIGKPLGRGGAEATRQPWWQRNPRAAAGIGAGIATGGALASSMMSAGPAPTPSPPMQRSPQSSAGPPPMPQGPSPVQSPDAPLTPEQMESLRNFTRETSTSLPGPSYGGSVLRPSPSPYYGTPYDNGRGYGPPFERGGSESETERMKDIFSDRQNAYEITTGQRPWGFPDPLSDAVQRRRVDMAAPVGLSPPTPPSPQPIPNFTPQTPVGVQPAMGGGAPQYMGQGGGGFFTQNAAPSSPMQTPPAGAYGGYDAMFDTPSQAMARPFARSVQGGEFIPAPSQLQQVFPNMPARNAEAMAAAQREKAFEAAERVGSDWQGLAERRTAAARDPALRGGNYDWTQSRYFQDAMQGGGGDVARVDQMLAKERAVDPARVAEAMANLNTRKDQWMNALESGAVSGEPGNMPAVGFGRTGVAWAPGESEGYDRMIEKRGEDQQRYTLARAIQRMGGGQQVGPMSPEVVSGLNQVLSGKEEPNLFQSRLLGGPQAAQQQMFGNREKNMMDLENRKIEAMGAGKDTELQSGTEALYAQARAEVVKQFPKMTDANMIHAETLKRLSPSTQARLSNPFGGVRANPMLSAAPGSPMPGAVGEGGTASPGIPDILALSKMTGDPGRIYQYLQNYPHLLTKQGFDQLLPILDAAGIDPVSIYKSRTQADVIPGIGPMTRGIASFLAPERTARMKKSLDEFWGPLARKRGG